MRGGLQAKVVEDDQVRAGEAREAPLVGAVGPPSRDVGEGARCRHDTTSYPRRQASWPRACARWLLPTPEGPTKNTFSCAATKRQVARSAISFCESFGQAEKSKV